MNVAKGRKLSAEAVGRLAEASLPGAREAARYAVSFLCGLLYARGVVFSRCAPFGAAAVAACPYRYLLSTMLGALAGALLPGQAQTPVRYLAAVLAAAAIRWTVNDVARLRYHPAFAPVTALLPLVSTGMAMAFVNGSPTSTVAVYFAESVLGAGGAYFAARIGGGGRAGGLRQTAERHGGRFPHAGGRAAPAAAGGSHARAGLARARAGLAARAAGLAQCRAAGGAVAGVAAGVLFSLSTAGLTYLSGAYALGGLMAGLFLAAGAALLRGRVHALRRGGPRCRWGTSRPCWRVFWSPWPPRRIFLALPARLGGQISGLFQHKEDAAKSDALRRTVVMKLDYAAKALGGVSEDGGGGFAQALLHRRATLR